MKISLCYTTARIGSFDMILNSAANQDMDKADFEVIVVDDFYALREFRVHQEWQWRYSDINFTHMAPNVAHDYYDNTHGFNTALRAAKGELIAFMIDYTWLEPDYLTSHWDFYQAHPGWSQTGYIDRFNFPALDISRLNMEHGWWGIFERDFNKAFAAQHFGRHPPVYQERKGHIGIVHSNGLVEMPGDKIYLIGDTVPRRVLEEINGLDERYDNGYGVNDIDCGVRCNLAGWHFGVNPNCVVKKLGTPELSVKIPNSGKEKGRTWEDNFAVFQERVKAMLDGREPVRVPNGFGAWA